MSEIRHARDDVRDDVRVRDVKGDKNVQPQGVGGVKSSKARKDVEDSRRTRQEGE